MQVCTLPKNVSKDVLFSKENNKHRAGDYCTSPQSSIPLHTAYLKQS